MTDTDIILIRQGDIGTPRNAARKFLEKETGHPVTVTECTRLGRHDGGVWRFEVTYEVHDD